MGPPLPLRRPILDQIGDGGLAAVDELLQFVADADGVVLPLQHRQYPEDRAVRGGVGAASGACRRAVACRPHTETCGVQVTANKHTSAQEKPRQWDHRRL